MAKFEDQDSLAPGKPFKQQTIENAEVNMPGPALASMLADLKRIATVLGGTNSMRDAGKDYLPQHSYETNEAYKRRVEMTYLDNYTLRTLNTLVGKAFKKPPALGDSPNKVIEEFIPDVDGQGTALPSFGREWFRSGIEKAVAHVLVDMPVAEPRADGLPRTKEDDRRDGLAPFWRHISANDMLDIQVAPRQLDGSTLITPVLVRFRDDYVVPTGLFGSRIQERVKVLRHEVSGVTWEDWELEQNDKRKKPKWIKTRGPEVYGMDRIPLVTFYTDKCGVGEGRSPLADLSHLNVRHWQSTSDQINILTVTRFPLLAASGVRDAEGEGAGGTLVIGPNKFITTPDPQSKVYFVEHTGAAVDSGTTELERLEEAMASYGAEFLKKGAQGPETASGRILDAGEAISPLQSWGLDFKDCLELALWYTVKWLNIENVQPEIEFEIDIDETDDTSDMSTVDAARTRKDISRDAWVNEAKRRGILSEDYDADEDQGKIDDEPPPPGGLEGMFPGNKPLKKAAVPPKE